VGPMITHSVAPLQLAFIASAVNVGLPFHPPRAQICSSPVAKSSAPVSQIWR
ncbi:hypothetical protein U1Q18_025086, partial [Sarracenia purpurea var. burkii]